MAFFFCGECLYNNESTTKIRLKMLTNDQMISLSSISLIDYFFVEWCKNS